MGTPANPQRSSRAPVVDLSAARERYGPPGAKGGAAAGGGTKGPNATDPELSTKAAQYDAFAASLATYLKPADVERIREAFAFSDSAHQGQMRASGEEYISHPMAVARILRLLASRRPGHHGGPAARRGGRHRTARRTSPANSAPRGRTGRRRHQARPHRVREPRRTRRRKISARCCWRWRATCA